MLKAIAKKQVKKKPITNVFFLAHRKGFKSKSKTIKEQQTKAKQKKNQKPEKKSNLKNFLLQIREGASAGLRVASIPILFFTTPFNLFFLIYIKFIRNPGLKKEKRAFEERLNQLEELEKDKRYAKSKELTQEYIKLAEKNIKKLSSQLAIFNYFSDLIILSAVPSLFFLHPITQISGLSKVISILGYIITPIILHELLPPPKNKITDIAFGSNKQK